MTLRTQPEPNANRASTPETPWSGEAPARPYLITNPAHDTAFRDAATACLREATTTEELEDRLRPRFPAVSVRRRLISAEPFVVWYVYRDGRWVGHASARSDSRAGDERVDQGPGPGGGPSQAE